ncbi:MAG: GNAT family N-acetyltransferase [Firmicutes bacterium]|nr:GNAT family N-acetyltransferase [Bacillota bacterium]
MDLYNLHSKRLEYRPFQETDFLDLVELLTNESVCEFLPRKKAYSEEVIHNWLTHIIKSFSIDFPNVIYAVIEPISQEVIGYAGNAYVKEYEKNEIMYAFKESAWHQGYATEAALKMKEVAIFLHQKEVIALADIHNIASQNVLKKVGFICKETVLLWGLEMYYYELVFENKR